MSCSSSSGALLILLLTILFCLPSSNSSRPRLKPVSFSAPLIHSNSPESPLYDPNISPADLSRLTARAAKARIRARNEASGLDAYTAPVIPRPPYPSQYFMKYKIGNPPIETYGIPDTGSELTWLQCLPCSRCYNQRIPIFDPIRSSSYKEILCTDDICKSGTEHLECRKGDNICSYYVSYEDGAMTTGDVATETITLQNDRTGGAVSLTNMVFGCGRYNKEHNETSQDLSPGVIGLNRGRFSLVGQIGFNEFSHCISATQDPASGHSLLKIGQGATITGPETHTPLYSHPSYGWYFVKIMGIKVGGIKLDIPPEVFQMNARGTRGTIIDTGTTFSELVGGAFDPLEAKIREQMRGAGYSPISDPDFDLCFTDVEYVPKIVIMFEGLDFELKMANTWEQIAPAKYCLTILRGSDNMSTVGMYMMRDVNVGYDLRKNIVSLAYTACPLIK